MGKIGTKKKCPAAKDSIPVISASPLDEKFAKKNNLDLEGIKNFAINDIRLHGGIPVFKTKSGKLFVCDDEKIAEEYREHVGELLTELKLDDIKSRLKQYGESNMDCLKNSIHNTISFENKEKAIMIYTGFKFVDGELTYHGEALSRGAARKVSYDKMKRDAGKSQHINKNNSKKRTQ